MWARQHILFFWGGCILALLACESPPKYASNQQMAELLAEMAAQAPQAGYPYDNSYNVAKLAPELASLPLKVPIGKRYTYLLELLKAGQNDKCIEESEAFLQAAFPDRTITYGNKQYVELLAMAYLRKGEVDNCIQHHSGESCIVPIGPGGVHQDPYGSEKAIELLTQLLAFDSTNLQQQWFLNLAYMTLGQYPHRVPKEFLIPETVFQSEREIPRFDNVAMKAGVAVEGHAGGGSLEDFNNDGYLDLFVSSYGLEDQARFFVNQRDGTFEDRTEEAGLRGLTRGLNLIHADYDNDGWEDIFILRGAWLFKFGQFPNSLLKNMGDGSFQDVTKEAGLLSFYPTQTAVWTDVNLDGWLDLFIGNEGIGNGNYPCELYINQQNGSFRNMAEAYGLDFRQYVKGVVAADVNNDGWPDLYVSVIGNTNRLYLNREGEFFEDISKSAGVQEPIHSFPAWFWDYNNDGWEDLFVSGYDLQEGLDISGNIMADYLDLPHEGAHAKLFRNNGDLTFTDVSREAKLDRLLYTMGCNYGDLDNDGFLDSYLGTGEFDLWSVTPNRTFRNASGQFFQDVTTAGGFGSIQKGHAVSFGDIDNDGDQDIHAVMGGAVEGDFYMNMLFDNPGNHNKWITLELQGRTANRSAIGSRVKLIVEQADGHVRSIHRTVSTGGSFGANSLQLEIGLGDATRIRELDIQWMNPERTLSRYNSVEMNRRYIVAEGADKLE
ncbi:MAG: CRTAC1 family protein [Bacteroidota bacterium]